MSTPSSIDPRLRQRRIAVRRAQGRRRLHVLIGIAVVGALVAGSYALSQSALLDLDAVNVDGVAGSEAAEVREAAGLVLGIPLVELDLAGANAAVTAVPWVESATTSRDWPGSATVRVVRRMPAAVMANGAGGFVVVDGQGVAMAEVEQIGDLPVIALVATGGLGSVQSQALPALVAAEAMPADVLPWVESISLDYRGGEGAYLTLDLVGSASVVFGDPASVADKFESLRTILGGIDLRCVEVIDVRVPDTATVTPDQECSIETEQDVS